MTDDKKKPKKMAEPSQLPPRKKKLPKRFLGLKPISYKSPKI